MNTAVNTAITAEPDEFTRAEQAAQCVRAALAQNPALGMPRLAVVLGSGLRLALRRLRLHRLRATPCLL